MLSSLFSLSLTLFYFSVAVRTLLQNFIHVCIIINECGEHFPKICPWIYVSYVFFQERNFSIIVILSFELIPSIYIYTIYISSKTSITLCARVYVCDASVCGYAHIMCVLFTFRFRNLTDDNLNVYPVCMLACSVLCCEVYIHFSSQFVLHFIHQFNNITIYIYMKM